VTTTRKLIIAFWVFIGFMLIWQLYSYNQGMNQQAIDHPTQTQFIFLHTNAAPVSPRVVRSDEADVEQTSFVVQPETPSAGSFTCLVTLKNVGLSKATDIQVCVRPFRGASNFDEDVGHQTSTGPLSDDDPISRFNDWLSFPDLAPGQSDTRSINFTNRTDYNPGVNPKPQIIFKTEKTPPKPAAAPAPGPRPPAEN
jgi:hypothetical protein